MNQPHETQSTTGKLYPGMLMMASGDKFFINHLFKCFGVFCVELTIKVLLND